MKTNTILVAAIATALAAVPAVSLAGGHNGGQAEKRGQAQRAQVERSQHDFDRDRIQDRDRLHDPAQDRDALHDPAQDRDRTRDQDRTHRPDTAGVAASEIYGQQMMTVEERNQYREQLQQLGSDDARKARFLAKHREEMQLRARVKGIDLNEAAEESE